MKTLAIASKTLLELWREPHVPGVALVFPVLLVVLYYGAFGQAEEGFASMLDVRVLDRDEGFVAEGGRSWRAGPELIEALRQEELDGQPLYSITEVVDEVEGLRALHEQKATLLLVIGAGFSERLATGAAPPFTGQALTATGDPSSTMADFGTALLRSSVRRFAHSSLRYDAPPELKVEFLTGTGTMEDIHYYVSGLIPFGIMLLILAAATVLVREASSGTLTRLRLTRAHAAHLHGGIALAHGVLAAVVVLAVFGTALAFGFPNHGQLPLAMCVGMLLSMSSVGLGLIIACFASSDGIAVSLASGVAVPMSMLSGAMFPLPDMSIGSLAGHTVEVFDFLPTTHAVEAMRRTLVHGEGASAVAYELAGLALLSALYLGMGIWLYQRRRMRGGG